MVCATWLLVLLCLLAAEVRSELTSSEKSAEVDVKTEKLVSSAIAADSQEDRIKRQNFNRNFGGQRFSFNRGRSSNSNSFGVPTQFSGGSRFITRGQPAFGGENFQRQSPRQITSPAPSQRQNNPLVLNNDPLGLFQRNSRFQSNQRSSQTLSTPQQIIDFQRQQQRQTLAGIRGRNPGFSSSQPSFSSQSQPSFSSQSFSNSPNPALLQRTRQQVQQFRPSVQLSQGRPQANVFQPAQISQLTAQPVQQGVNSIQQPQALQQQQQQLQQQQLQQQQLQQQQLQIRQQQLQQQQLQQQQRQRQQQQLQRQQQQQQLLQQLLQRQQGLNQLRQQQLQQQQLQRQQLRQQLLQQQALQRQASAAQALTTPASRGIPLQTTSQAARTRQPTAQVSFGVPLQTSRPSVRPTAFSRPTSNIQQSFSAPSQPISINSQSSFGVPLQSIPTRPPQPARVVRPTTTASFRAPSTTQQRPNVGVLLAQTRPQIPVRQVQTQSFAGAGGLINPQRGGFALVVDDDRTFEDDRTDEILDSRELFFGGGRRQLGLGVNAVSGFRQSFSPNLSRGRSQSGFQIRPDITDEDFTIEVNSREFFGARNPITTGGFQPSFGVRVPRVTFEDLTDENFTREDLFTDEDFDD